MIIITIIIKSLPEKLMKIFYISWYIILLKESIKLLLTRSMFIKIKFYESLYIRGRHTTNRRLILCLRFGVTSSVIFIINSQTKNQVLITKMNEMKWNWMKTTNIWWKGEWAISFWIYAKRHPNSRNKNIILIAFSQQKP